MRIALGAAVIAAAVSLGGCAPPKHFNTGSAVRLEADGGVGSGVYIGNGIIITAAHVVNRDAKFKLKVDGSDLVQDVEVLWLNTTYDIAAVTVADAASLNPSRLDCSEPPVGTAVSTVGNPLGEKFIAAHGYVAHRSEDQGKWKSAMTLDMTALMGNSGGPLYDEEGSVRGIVTGVLGVNGVPVGMSYAVPSAIVCKLLGRATV